ncbi:unnamed protein product [Haemonchus placei]|uniref:Uncharacterized protein n=1 Tax=Haemonchus placei TaxID=6290 RepID=A0A3P8BJY5_HAEPC|nr:unnamed protein product [Haemonchus placei]
MMMLSAAPVPVIVTFASKTTLNSSPALNTSEHRTLVTLGTM